MSPAANWLAIFAVFAVPLLALYLLRRKLARRQSALVGRLNEDDYVVIEANPLDFPMLKEDWLEHGWDFVRADGASGERKSYRFERSSAKSTLLGVILLDQRKKKAVSADQLRGDPMTLKETGLKRSPHAQTH